MVIFGGWSSRRLRLIDGLHARLIGLQRATARFASPPEPHGTGYAATGERLAAGELRLGGEQTHLAPGASFWDAVSRGAAMREAAHGFAWLDDLAAAGTPAATRAARLWTADWVARYGRGRGPGWQAGLAGPRLLHWLNHAEMILHHPDPATEAAFMAACARHLRFVSRRWRHAPAGQPRFAALAALAAAAQRLQGAAPMAAIAASGLAREAALRIDAGGGIASRNPEELTAIFALVTGAAATLQQTGRPPAAPVAAAIGRMVPVLRALRHADGGLACMNGGGRGVPGRLDAALAEAGQRLPRPQGPTMGYQRLSAGRTSLIVDAAPPPRGPLAHAGTLGFELTSGRRPVVVSCGPGQHFGGDWARMARATACHSTLVVAGLSSARSAGDGAVAGTANAVAGLAAAGRAAAGMAGAGSAGAGGAGGTLRGPRHVRVQLSGDATGQRIVATHDGYVDTHGLTHERDLALRADGRVLRGRDSLIAATQAERRRLDRALAHGGQTALAYALHFHLHPDVAVVLDRTGLTATLTLRSGEVWRFAFDGVGRLAVEPSVWFDRARPAPVPIRQLVIRAELADYAGRIGWTLAKAQDTPIALRDLVQDDMSPASG